MVPLSSLASFNFTSFCTDLFALESSYFLLPLTTFDGSKKVLLAGQDFHPLITTIPSDLAVREAAKPEKRRASEDDIAASPKKKTMTDATMQVDNPQETVEMIKHGEIDESLYSRQL
ncbi:hypothetical protein N7492_006219 [Penicillium capsulatum]|uniref:Uncharacterized protein n=1 Tax=Penicillium capsulatum TaxID=69766 RepID=A0A9W9LMS3_9EURO|nr:hypothetical protein N7492_006219 [Penicillium capsulatum]KAJ6108872.1 hypothetical protein N7512_008709 [Penicillium capsulatum]